jgi:hypothetical protein
MYSTVQYTFQYKRNRVEDLKLYKHNTLCKLSGVCVQYYTVLCFNKRVREEIAVFHTANQLTLKANKTLFGTVSANMKLYLDTWECFTF